MKRRGLPPSNIEPKVIQCVEGVEDGMHFWGNFMWEIPGHQRRWDIKISVSWHWTTKGPKVVQNRSNGWRNGLCHYGVFFCLSMIRMFPKIMVSPNHPVLIGFSHYKPSIWGPTPIFGNTQIRSPFGDRIMPTNHWTKKRVILRSWSTAATDQDFEDLLEALQKHWLHDGSFGDGGLTKNSVIKSQVIRDVCFF